MTRVETNYEHIGCSGRMDRKPVNVGQMANSFGYFLGSVIRFGIGFMVASGVIAVICTLFQ